MTAPVLPRVVIVGCGALGSHVALFLRNEGQLVLIDGDRVEAKNVLSQHHGKAHIGKNKGESLRGYLALAHGIVPAPVVIPRMLTPQNVEALLGDAALVIDCTDNAMTRHLMRGVNVIHAALAAGEEGYGQVTWDTANYHADANDGAKPTCRAGENLPMAALVAAYTAKAAQRFLHEGKRIGYAISSAGAVAL